MKIRTKITLTFFLIVIVILSMVSGAIYFSSANYRESDFYRRLKNRAINTTNIFIEFRELEPDLLRILEQDNPANLPNQFVAIFNERDRKLYASDSAGMIPIESALLTRIAPGKDLRFRHNDFEVLGFIFNDNDHQYRVVAAATDFYGYDALQNLRNILLIVLAVSILLVSVSGWLYAGRILAPISRIVDEVDSITEASLNLRLDEGNRKDELSKLAQTFNRMLTRIEEAFLSQKNFIANASHELRTPIAVIIAELEASLLQLDHRDEHHATLASVLENAKALNSLANQLLLLAQTSAVVPEKKFEAIRVDEILWEVKQDVEKVHPEYSIDIHFDLTLNAQSLIINGDEQLIRIVFANIIDNGCKYAFDNAVQITLKIERDNVAIYFTNRGPGIPSADLSRIFKPFYRGSNFKNIKGYGIGLSLASTIVTLHKGTIKAESTPGDTTTFIVTLPGVR